MDQNKDIKSSDNNLSIHKSPKENKTNSDDKNNDDVMAKNVTENKKLILTKINQVVTQKPLSDQSIRILTPEYKIEMKCDKKNNTGCCGRKKLEVFNWLADFPPMYMDNNLIEVQFKNTRKEYFVNNNNIEVCIGDIVVVEANPGYDIGEVTLMGKLVELQIKKVNYRSEIRRLYRIAKPADIEKYEQYKEREHKTMLRAREIAEELKLEMKISDVEIQGDGSKAIFYYIADGRVDFRQLIKYYANQFKLKIEMKQIGARQEAGRVGGIGPCGRKLCCSNSMTKFISVSTYAARIQDITLNPQKLAGQCGKLKCCMNFEVDVYLEAQKKLPPTDIALETLDGTYFPFKTDILKGLITYSTDRNYPANLITISAKRVFEIIKLNKKGEKPNHLDPVLAKETGNKKTHDLLETESITRFDSERKKDGNKNKRRNKKNRVDNPEKKNQPIINSISDNGEKPVVQNNREKSFEKKKKERNNKIPSEDKVEKSLNEKNPNKKNLKLKKNNDSDNNNL